MKKIEKKIPIVLFILLTLVNYILGIWFFEINLIFGGSSIVVLFLLVLESKSRAFFFIYLIYDVAYWSCLIYCLVTKQKKGELIAFLILNSIEMLVCASLIVYKLCIANYLSIWICVIGFFVKAIYTLLALWYMSKKGKVK